MNIWRFCYTEYLKVSSHMLWKQKPQTGFWQRWIGGRVSLESTWKRREQNWKLLYHFWDQDLTLINVWRSSHALSDFVCMELLKNQDLRWVQAITGILKLDSFQHCNILFSKAKYRKSLIYDSFDIWFIKFTTLIWVFKPSLLASYLWPIIVGDLVAHSGQRSVFVPVIGTELFHKTWTPFIRNHLMRPRFSLFIHDFKPFLWPFTLHW